MTIDAITKGLVTKASKNHDGGVSFRALLRRLQASGLAREQAKHRARRLIEART